MADLISEVEAALELSGKLTGAALEVAERRGDHDCKPVEAAAQLNERQLQLEQTTANPEVEQGVLATRESAERNRKGEREEESEPAVLQPRDTLEEHMAKMDSLQDRWMKRTKIDGYNLAKTANMVTVTTFMDDE